MQKHVWFIILVFFTFYSVFGALNYLEFGTPNNSNDFYFHFFKAKGEYSPMLETHYSLQDFQKYPSLFHVLFTPFTANTFVFYLALMVLICVLIPIIIYGINSKWFSVLLYFTVVSLPHMVIYNATYAQALVIVWLLAYILLRKKSKLFYLLFLVLAWLTHREGIILFAIVGFIELLAMFKQKFALMVILQGVNTRAFPNLVEIFVLHLNPVVWWLLLKSKKNFFYNALIVVGFVVTWFDSRTIFISQIGIILSITQKPNKWVWLGLLIYLIIYLYSFLGATISLLY